jgi:hypothetical protein
MENVSLKRGVTRINLKITQGFFNLFFQTNLGALTFDFAQDIQRFRGKPERKHC